MSMEWWHSSNFQSVGTEGVNFAMFRLECEVSNVT